MLFKQHYSNMGKTSEIDLIKQALNQGVVGYICSNPHPDLIGGIELSSTEKNRRLQKLINIVSSEGYQFYQGGGRYRETENTSSLIIFGITQKRLTELGLDFEQESVIHSRANHHTVIYLNGPQKGSKCFGHGWTETSPEADDGYCFIQLNNGAQFIFITHINWSNRKAPSEYKVNHQEQMTSNFLIKCLYGMMALSSILLIIGIMSFCSPLSLAGTCGLLSCGATFFFNVHHRSQNTSGLQADSVQPNCL